MLGLERSRMGWLALPLSIGLLLAVACASPDSTPPPGATPTPPPAAPGETPAPGVTPADPAVTATPAPVTGQAPQPQTPNTQVILGAQTLWPAVGLNREIVQFGDYVQRDMAETLFTTEWYEAYLEIGGEPSRPWLIEGYEFSGDMSTLRLFVKQGVEFQDGWGEMTADDIAWNLNDIKGDVTPASTNPQAGDHAALFGGEWRVVDQYTVEVDVNIPDPRMFAHNLGLQFQGPPIFSKAHYDSEGAEAARENMVSTGAFQVVEFARDDIVIGEKWTDDHHWVNPEYDRLIVQVIPEQTVRNANLMTGEIDAAGVSIVDVQTFLDAGFETAYWGSAGHRGIFFSGNLWETHHALTGEPLDWGAIYANPLPWISPPDDPVRMENAAKVRRALGMAINREEINEFVLDGLGYPVHHAYFNPQDANWDAQWEYNYDPQAARDLLADAGYPNGFNMPLYVHGGESPIQSEIGDIIGTYWENIGVNSDILKYHYSVFRPGVVGRTNTVPWNTNCDEGTSLPPWDWPKGLVMTSMTRGGFSCGFESPFIAENFLKMVDEPDLAERTLLANAFIDYLHEWSLEVGVIGIPNYIVYNPNKIAGWEMRRAGGSNNYGGIQIAR